MSEVTGISADLEKYIWKIKPQLAAAEKLAEAVGVGIKNSREDCYSDEDCPGKMVYTGEFVISKKDIELIQSELAKFMGAKDGE